MADAVFCFEKDQFVKLKGIQKSLADESNPLSFDDKRDLAHKLDLILNNVVEINEGDIQVCITAKK
jgi:hypothetical protein